MNYYSEDVFQEEISDTFEEGHRRIITVNKYECSSIARNVLKSMVKLCLL